MLSLTTRRPFLHMVPSVVSAEAAARPFAAALQATSFSEIIAAGMLLAAAVFPVGAFLLVLVTAALR
jgi:hypothetical protein